MFTFSEMLALVESESSFGAYVCHRRPGGYRANSDLVVLYKNHPVSTVPVFDIFFFLSTGTSWTFWLILHWAVARVSVCVCLLDEAMVLKSALTPTLDTMAH